MTHRASPFPYLNTLVSYLAERFRGVCFVACEEAERVAAALWLAVISYLCLPALLVVAIHSQIANRNQLQKMLTSTQRCNKYLKLDKTVGDVEDSKSRRAPHCRVLPLDSPIQWHGLRTIALLRWQFHSFVTAVSQIYSCKVTQN